MQKTTILAALAMAVAANVGASTVKPSVVSGAQPLTTAEKADITGMCGCGEAPVLKPGYGFGAKVEHYGPPGQGFNPYYTWRDALSHGWGTPKGNSLPPRAPSAAAAHPFP